jgi:SAM-dependent methyltransferase
VERSTSEARRFVEEGTTIASQPFDLVWKYSIHAPVIAVAVSADCSSVSAASTDGGLYFFGRDGRLKWRARLDEEAWATAMTTDGTLVAAGDASESPTIGNVYVFDREGNQLFKKRLPAPVWSVAFSKDSKNLVAGCWDGSIRRFSRSNDSDWVELPPITTEAPGVYGTGFMADGSLVAGLYDRGILRVNQDGVKDLTPIDSGIYAVSCSVEDQIIVAGLRSGSVALCKGNGFTTLGPISQRPVCGVAITPDGRLIVAGAFDGRFHLMSPSGMSYWNGITAGEVWSVAVSSDASRVCIGSDDGTVRVLSNRLTLAACRETQTLEEQLLEPRPPAERQQVLRVWVTRCLELGLVTYAAKYLRQLANRSETSDYVDATVELLIADTIANPGHAESHLLLADEHQRRRAYLDAALSYVAASKLEHLRLTSLTRAARCFERVGLESAAMSCRRRAREQVLHTDEMRVLYETARSYEDLGNIAEATKHYEILLSWEPGYRDVERRVRELSRGHTSGAGSGRDVDYTVLTVNIVDPEHVIENPQLVDPAIVEVHRARIQELHVDHNERLLLHEAVAARVPQRVADAETANVSYDITAYIKYDFLLPEDELKKELELLHVLAALREHRLIGGDWRCSSVEPRIRSLDVGAATGRYPALLQGLGFEAYGVDVEPRAMEFASSKRVGGEFPAYVVGNAIDLPFAGDSFSLVTCMMGTWAHISRGHHERVCKEVWRCLAPGGLWITSTWDIDCRHLSFLSMYPHEEREFIRRDSRSREEHCKLLRDVGFGVVRVPAFAMLPDVFGYELGVRGFNDRRTLERLVRLDLAARSTFPDMNGQMYMTLAVRPD